MSVNIHASTTLPLVGFYNTASDAGESLCVFDGARVVLALQLARMKMHPPGGRGLLGGRAVSAISRPYLAIPGIISVVLLCFMRYMIW